MTDRHVEDGVLVDKALKGDRDALDDLVYRYQARTFQFAYRLCGDEEQAADLTAEAFARVYANLARFRRESRFSTWLFRIVTNAFLDQQKKDKVRQKQSLDDVLSTEEGELSLQVPSDSASPHDAAEQSLQSEAISAAIQSLPEHYRVMIVLFHVEMLSYEEIGEALDLPVGTVKSRLNRARLALREILEPVVELFQA